jgi:hypothetical protein
MSDYIKHVKDGYVAIITAEPFGVGWYSVHGIKELIFDPNVVEMVENKTSSKQIIRYCRDTYGMGYYAGAEALRIMWLAENIEFSIKIDRDGVEEVLLKDEFDWITS